MDVLTQLQLSALNALVWMGWWVIAGSLIALTLWLAVLIWEAWS